MAESERARHEGGVPPSVQSATSHSEQQEHDAREMEKLLDLLAKASDRSLRDQAVIIKGGPFTSVPSASSDDKQKEHDVRELEELLDLLGKASGRSLRDQAVIVEGGMQNRLEKAQQKIQHHPLNTMEKPALRLSRVMEVLISRGRQRLSGGAKRSPTSVQSPDNTEFTSPRPSPGKSSFEFPMRSPISGPETTTTSARRLLKEHTIQGIEYDSPSREPPPRCCQGTRTQLHEKIIRWIFDENRQEALLWLNGPAGAGKSALIQSLAESLSAWNLAASLLFSGSNDNWNGERIFATIAFQLSARISSYQAYIAEQITLYPDLLQGGMEKQFRVFITEPFGEEKIGKQEGPWVILLDGLDKCEGLDQQRKFVYLISWFTFHFSNAPLVWVIASRTEAHLSQTFMDVTIAPSYRSEYVSIDSPEARKDVQRYMGASFNVLRRQFPDLPSNWPNETVSTKLANSASGLFLFAKAAIDFIGDSEHASPASRLSLIVSIIEGSPAAASDSIRPFASLDAMYTQIMRSIPHTLWNNTKQILGFSLCARGGHDFPLLSRSFLAASNILRLDPHMIYSCLFYLHSVLNVPPPKYAHQRGVSFLHDSFADYLMDPARSLEFYISIQESLDDIINNLRDIYRSGAWGSKLGRLLHPLSVKEEEDFYEGLNRDAMAAMNSVVTEDSIGQKSGQSPSPNDHASYVDNYQSNSSILNITSTLEDVMENDVGLSTEYLLIKNNTTQENDQSSSGNEPNYLDNHHQETQTLNKSSVFSGGLYQDIGYDIVAATRYFATEDDITHENDRSFFHKNQSDRAERPQSDIEIVDGASTLALDSPSSSEGNVTHLLQTRILSSRNPYKALLEAKGSTAQRILDLLQDLLNSAHIDNDAARGSILTALLRLSASSGLYPRQLRLHDIEEESIPVTSGQFGDIWKGKYQGRSVCLKVFKLTQRSEIDQLLKRCSREAIVWSQLTHPNVLTFYGIYHLDDAHGRIGLVSPWMGNGNLPEYLKAHPESRRLPFVHNILAGLRYLHRHQVVHGDLKGVNILIGADGSACLADFGLSSVIDADVLRWSSLATITQIGGTVRWMAPEIIEAAEDGLSSPSFESDIYSLASVMFEVFTGQIPYCEYPRDTTVLLKVTLGIKPGRPTKETAPELTDSIWEIMIDCWNKSPGDRPTLNQVISGLSAQHTPRAQPAQVELRSPISPEGALAESDMTFLMSLLNVD